MAYLFDTDAISEVLRRRPLAAYIDWLAKIPREEQFTSAVVLGELCKGAYRARVAEIHLANIEERVLQAVTVLPFDIGTARVFGRLRALLEDEGLILPDADLQIAATAIYHDLELVTGNVRHFVRIRQLKLNRVLGQLRKLRNDRR